jgi:imidazolonepropionase-like amidohydrolase
LVAAAVEEAQASSGWCKVIGDWRHNEPPVPLDVLRSVVDAVHTVGGKVAVHSQTAEGGRNAVLAGTDSLPFGKVSEEIDWLIRAGLPADAALGAASWVARAWLGLPGLVDGAPADLVAYPVDPTKDPAVLAHPSHVILRGRVIAS